jgi:hypothetical protein
VVIIETFWTKICGLKPGPDLKLGIRLRHVALSEKAYKAAAAAEEASSFVSVFPGVFLSFGDCPD